MSGTSDLTVRAVNIGDILARVDGMRMTGNVVGLAMVQVANDSDAPMIISGNFASGLVRGSSLPGIRIEGTVEDFGIPKTCAPGANLDDLRAIRLTGARAIMPGSSLRRAVMPAVNFQGADLRGSDMSDLVATNGFFEESDMRGAIVSPETDLGGAHLADARRDAGMWHADNVKGADFGPAGPAKGNPRASMRREVAAEAATKADLGA